MSEERYEGEAESPAQDVGDAESRPVRGGAGEAGSPPRRGRRLPLPIVAALVLVAAVAGYLVGSPKYPLDTSADAGFLRDMSVHHDQAVDMSLTLRPKAESREMRTLTYDIARTQQAQIGQMRGWLVQWDLPIRASQPAMTWMAHHDHDYGGEGTVPERMPGYATDEQMDALAEAEGTEAEILFLEMMIEHHIGGVDMAEAALALADEDYVLTLAESMVVAQESEISMMEDLLAERRGMQ